MPDAVVAGSLDAVGVVPGALDDPRVGPVAARRVEVAAARDAGHDPVQSALPLLRGKAGPAADDADGALELDPVRVHPGRGGRLADQGADGVVRQQVAVDLLPDHVRFLRPQHLPRPAQIRLQLPVPGLKEQARLHT